MGVFIDDKFKVHNNHLCSKVSKSIGIIIIRLGNILPKSSLVSIYYALVYPYLTNCNLAWGSINDCHLDPFIKLQKRALRLMCNVGFNADTNELFYSCNLLKLKYIHKFKLAVYMYKLNSSLTADYHNNHHYNTR